MSPRIIYMHGFNSSPQSAKARQLGEILAARGEAACYACPALPDLPAAAIAVAQAEIRRQTGAAITLVGSSLGGFYATWLAESHDCKAVLINPAIRPDLGLRAYLGPQQNLHTGERYELAEEHLRQWQGLLVPAITPERYLLLVETGDEVLDYRAAVERYAGARQVVVRGGDHAFHSFLQHVPQILAFAGFEAVPGGNGKSRTI
jgi:predicted esterase YcpF (UPF0227 family)